MVDDPDVLERQIVNAAAVVEEIPRLLIGEGRPGVRRDAQPEADGSIGAQRSLLGELARMLDRDGGTAGSMSHPSHRFCDACRQGAVNLLLMNGAKRVMTAATALSLLLVAPVPAGADSSGDSPPSPLQRVVSRLGKRRITSTRRESSGSRWFGSIPGRRPPFREIVG